MKTYSYDDRGRAATYTLTVDGAQISTATYSYDLLNRLTSVTEGGVTTAYTYDASGLRKVKTVGGSTKYFIYNGMNIVFEYEDSVSDGVAYYYGINRTHNSNEVMPVLSALARNLQTKIAEAGPRLGYFF